MTGILSWIFSFLVTGTFESLIEIIGVAGTFWIYSGIAAFGALFVTFVVPETQRKPLANIHAILERKEIFVVDFR